MNNEPSNSKSIIKNIEDARTGKLIVKRREERLPEKRGLNDRERQELLRLFEKRKSLSFDNLKSAISKQEDIHLRMPGTRSVTFELLGANKFGARCNFGHANDISELFKSQP
jgi:hypothetical protein